MKPTFQTSTASRRGLSQRPQGHNLSKSPATDWSFQSSTANLHARTALPQTEAPESTAPSLHKLSEAFAAADSRESRFEALFFGAVIALAAWPIADVLYVAANTVR